MHGSEVGILNDDEDEDASCTKGFWLFFLLDFLETFENNILVYVNHKDNLEIVQELYLYKMFIRFFLGFFKSLFVVSNLSNLRYRKKINRSINLTKKQTIQIHERFQLNVF